MKRQKKKSPTPRVTMKTLSGSAPARKLSAAVLEVLAGLRTPSDAAAGVGVSLPRYYALEARALQGLITALEPRGKGRQVDPQARHQRLEKDNARLQREVGRLQALVRAAHRGIGLVPVAPVKTRKKAARRKRRPQPRARKALAVLRVAGHSADNVSVSSPAPQE